MAEGKPLGLPKGEASACVDSDSKKSIDSKGRKTVMSSFLLVSGHTHLAAEPKKVGADLIM